MNVMFVAGSQANKVSQNKIYVMRWQNIKKELDDDSSSSSDEDNDKQKEKCLVDYKVIPHKGGVNRIRSMYGSSIVATQSEDGEVGIYDIQPAINAFN